MKGFHLFFILLAPEEQKIKQEVHCNRKLCATLRSGETSEQEDESEQLLQSIDQYIHHVIQCLSSAVTKFRLLISCQHVALCCRHGNDTLAVSHKSILCASIFLFSYIIKCVRFDQNYWIEF